MEPLKSCARNGWRVRRCRSERQHDEVCTIHRQICLKRPDYKGLHSIITCNRTAAAWGRGRINESVMRPYRMLGSQTISVGTCHVPVINYLCVDLTAFTLKLYGRSESARTTYRMMGSVRRLRAPRLRLRLGLRLRLRLRLAAHMRFFTTAYYLSSQWDLRRSSVGFQLLNDKRNWLDF